MSPFASEVAEYYTQVRVGTASHPMRICMLHDRFIELCSRALLVGEPERRELLDRAQNICAQLQTVLRIEDAVSHSLFYVYDYAYVSLERGNDTDIANAAAVIDSLRQAFLHLLKNL